MMGGVGSGLRPISTSTFTINTFYVIVKVIVADILRYNSTSFTITPTTTSFIFVNNIIHMARRTRYKQQYIMLTWFMGGQVAGLGHIHNSPITTKSFTHIARGKVTGLFIPKSTSAIINYYITPWFSIITTSIYPPTAIIKTDITLLFFIKVFIYTTRRNWWSQQSTTVTWVTVGIVDGLRTIYTSTLSINSCSTFLRRRVAGILWHISTSTNITTMRISAFTRGIVDGLKKPMSMSSITRRHFKTFVIRNSIFVMPVGGRMSGITRTIS